MDNYAIIASLKSESTCKLINRIPGLDLFISSITRDSTSILEALPGKLDIKRHSPSILAVFTHSSMLLPPSIIEVYIFLIEF